MDIEVPASLSGLPSFAINLHTPRHPDFLSGGTNYLRKYWEVTTTEIDPISSLKFYYNQGDVLGNRDEFIPGYYSPAYFAGVIGGEWEIDLGTTPDVVYTANPADGGYISLTSTQPLTGDVTVAILSPTLLVGIIIVKVPMQVLETGIFRLTGQPKGMLMTDYPSSYYPGELYENDIVFIDGDDQINYNISDVTSRISDNWKY